MIMPMAEEKFLDLRFLTPEAGKKVFFNLMISRHVRTTNLTMVNSYPEIWKLKTLYAWRAHSWRK